MPLTIDTPTARRLLWHESQVHAIPHRVLRDLGDGFLLHDPTEAEPFWNRVAGVRWPSDPDAFDRRLAEVAVLFAAAGRSPHVWLLPPHDAPADLYARLRSNGFADEGAGHVMVAGDAERAREALARPVVPGASLERLRCLEGDAMERSAHAIVDVLLSAFEVEDERRLGVVAETRATLADPRFTHYLVHLDGRPAAVARRATFDGVSYLSSIGTVAEARGLGLGRVVTATAMVDAVDAGSEWIHLGVYAGNLVAFTLYQGLGFVPAGEPGPDMILRT